MKQNSGVQLLVAIWSSNIKLIYIDKLFFSSESWEKCFLGHKESPTTKYHNFGMGEQLCVSLQQRQSQSSFQHVSLSIPLLSDNFMAISVMTSLQKYISSFVSVFNVDGVEQIPLYWLLISSLCVQVWV
jgi:hypothetical protein